MAQVSYGTITITDTNDIESITVEYNRNQSPSDAPSSTDSGWSTTRPDWAQGYYIWQRTRVHKSGTTADKDVIGTAVCITGSTGQTGTSITISSIKYAVSTTESQPADSSFTYISVPTVAEGAWLWTLVTYSNGSKAYMKSKQGVSGDSITVSKVEYQSGTSPTSAPTGTWQTSIPTVAEGNYLWTKTTYSDGNYTYSVAKQGKSGTSVSISSTSTTYQVSTSPTTTPTSEWKTTVQSTTTGQYLWTRTIVTYSDGNSTTSYSVAAHGATGTSIGISSIKYAISSTESQPADSSFTYTSVPTVNEGQWLWTLTTYSNGSKMYTKSKQGKSGSDGQSLTATKTEYTIAANNVTINLSNHTSYTWTTNTPDYDASKPAYWGRITNTYANPAKTEYLFYKDEAITKAIADAAIANSIAQHANEDVQGAMSQAASAVKEVKRIWFAKATSDLPVAPPETGVTTGSASTYNSWSIVKPAENSSYPYYFYCDQTCTNGGVYSHSEILLEADPYTVNALNVRTKNFFHGKDSTYDGWFASGRSTSEGLDESDATTYYYNARVGATNITLGYNKTPVIDLDGGSGAINIYRLPTINSSTKLVTAAGKIGAKLNASALTFYNTSGTATSTFGDSIALASNGASITIGSTGTGKYNTYIDAQGLYLRTGTTSYATLNSNGLVLSKGGIKAGDYSTSSNKFIYLSTEDYSDSPTITINGNSSNWRQIIGTKFGVKNDGTLYANNAVISGSITLGTGSKIGTTDASTVVTNASTGAGAASDLATYKETVSDTYATKDALFDVEDQIPDVSGLASKTESIKSVTTETQYRLSNSSTNLTGSGTGYSWSTTIPTWVNNTYLWTRIATTYTPVSGSATTVYKPGTEINQWGIYDSQLTIALSTASAANTKADGAASTVTTTQEYRLSNSSTSLTGSGTGYTWSSTIPTWVNNTYLWTRFKIEKASVGGTTTTTYTPGSSDKEYGIYDSALTIALSTASSAKSTAEAAAPKSSAIAEEQLIYIQAISGTNSVSAYPSSSTTTSSYWVTQTGESIPNGTPPDSATGQTPIWTTKRPSYQKNYPVIFVAKQKKTVSGAITCTTPIKDDTTTIIDGGHITTGTIDATKVTVTNLQASSIAVGSSNVAAALDTKASNSAEYEVVVKVNSINYTTSSATLIAIPTKLGASTTGSFVWYKNAIGTAHEGTVSTTTNTNDTLTVADLNALYIAVLQ